MTPTAEALLASALRRPSRAQQRMLDAGWTPVAQATLSGLISIRWVNPAYTTPGMSYSVTQVGLVLAWEAALAHAYGEATVVGKVPSGDPALHLDHAMAGLIFLRNAAPPSTRCRGRWISMAQQERDPAPQALGFTQPSPTTVVYGRR